VARVVGMRGVEELKRISFRFLIMLYSSLSFLKWMRPPEDIKAIIE
jgi:hypothetical protein